MITQGYHFGAPSQDAEEIDARIAESLACPNCGGSMHYEGYHRQHNGRYHYIALAVCNSCGHETSF
jgi:hypothetical protein